MSGEQREGGRIGGAGGGQRPVGVGYDDDDGDDGWAEQAAGGGVTAAAAAAWAAACGAGRQPPERQNHSTTRWATRHQAGKAEARPRRQLQPRLTKPGPGASKSLLSVELLSRLCPPRQPAFIMIAQAPPFPSITRAVAPVRRRNWPWAPAGGWCVPATGPYYYLYTPSTTYIHMYIVLHNGCLTPSLITL